ncbi:hypothetical protein Zm00014a_044499 [Zea mays]|uniref:Uncharacterized protein n=1 Tax=Zea mays TaxID=4577 RepID=A0A3L6FGA0_MAIZE|nr:hypothetical protein Zm00014a_044497 [Zea mays]PWZ30718.1 hypothetical protein Zm00014a_044499 [Zea mays]
MRCKMHMYEYNEIAQDTLSTRWRIKH